MSDIAAQARGLHTRRDKPSRRGSLALLLPVFALILLLTQTEFSYTLRVVALGGALLGMVAGMLGCFAVQRQESLMGDALSHAALPGIAVGFLLAGRELGPLMLGAGAASWAGILLIGGITRTTRIKQDAAMAIVLTAFFALGLALLTYIQGRNDASQAGLNTFIFGQAAAIVERDVQLIAVVGVVAIGIMVLFWKEFKLITFDFEFARANGIHTRLYELLLSMLIVVAIVLGLQLAGVILMVGMLIAPAVAARQWTQRLETMVMLAGVFGALAGGIGAVVSGLDTGLPTGPLIIVVAVGLAFVSLLFAPERGQIWKLLRARRDRRTFAAQNALRDLYRHAHSHNDPFQPTEEAMLVRLHGPLIRGGLRTLAQEGLAERLNGHWRLTDAGVRRALQDSSDMRLLAVRTADAAAET
jgi:manganese/zinc/iron transport system permease protein